MEETKQRSGKVRRQKLKEQINSKESITEEKNVPQIDEKDWQKDKLPECVGYVSGWKGIMKFLLKEDPRICRFVLDQLKYRHRRVKRKKPKTRLANKVAK